MAGPVGESSPGQKKSNDGVTSDNNVFSKVSVNASHFARAGLWPAGAFTKPLPSADTDLSGSSYFRAMQNLDTAVWEARFTDYLKTNTHTKDGSHDLGHFQRVWKAAQHINQEEGNVADPLVLLASAYFHDLVSLPKNSPERSSSSRLSAERTVILLTEVFTDFPPGKVEGVRHAIHAHSFSAQVEPLTPEAKILQDADRMEALGAIGLARVFYTAGVLHQRLFDGDDPLALRRELNDQQYSLDHFAVKLFRLPALMNTTTGRKLADEKVEYLRQFLQKIEGEIAGRFD